MEGGEMENGEKMFLKDNENKNKKNFSLVVCFLLLSTQSMLHVKQKWLMKKKDLSLKFSSSMYTIILVAAF